MAVRWGVTVLAFGLLALGGCGESGAPVQSVKQASTADGASRPLATQKVAGSESAQEAVIDFAAIGLAHRTPRAQRPGKDWETEQFSDEASAQLELVGKLLTGGGTIAPQDLVPLAHQDVRSAALRPTDLTVVLEDRALVVRRPSATAASSPSNLYHGRAGLAAALNALKASLDGATAVRCQLKIFRVTLSGAEASTAAHFHLSGRTSKGVLEQTALWNCQWDNSSSTEPPIITSIEIVDYEHVLGRGEQPLFADCTEAILGHTPAFTQQLAFGVDHWLDRIERRYGINAEGWQGLALGDVNGDGLDDVYICQPGGLPNRLFVQQPDGTVDDVSESAGVDWRIHTHSALLVDLDNDGDQDLVIATKLGLILMANDGLGSFSVKSSKLIPEADPISLSAADFDQDGDLDLYACCYSLRGSALTVQVLGRPSPYHDANNGGRNVLFRNDRNWRFTNATKEVGLDQNNRRFSLAAAWEDYDNDGDLDLYVANDFGRNNLYRNHAGRFTDVAAEAGVEDISAGMSVSWGDYNNDGWMDLYVSNMWSSAGNRIAYQRQFLRAEADDGTLAQFRRHARGNSLFANSGNADQPAFLDVSQSAAVTMGRWAWASHFFDLNNDGWEDLIVANGFITGDDPGDL
jgi:hypothetical protein